MGAALLVHWQPEPDAGAAEAFARVAAAFPPRVNDGMTERRVEQRGLRGIVWSHDLSLGDGLVRDEATGSWLMLVGNPHRRDLAALAGPALFARVLDDCLARGAAALDSLSPPFAAVFHDGRSGETTVATDRCALQSVYWRADPDGGMWFASSALALATALPATLDSEGVAEWVGAGHFLTQRTLFREIRKVDCGARHVLGPAGARAQAPFRPQVPEPTTPEDYLGCLLDSVASCRRPELLAGELTGGLDSRLVWAGMLEQGIDAFAWTVGQPGSIELRTVERLTAEVPIPHFTVPVGAHLAPRIPELLTRMHRLAEGEVNALEYAPLLVAFDALDQRRAVSFSGGGGELARGFYFSALQEGNGNGGIAYPALVARLKRLSGRLPGGLRRERVPAADEVLNAAVHEVIDGSRASNPGAVLDDLYLRARMQRFAGRNVSTTGLFCRQALPYFDNALVQVSMGLPTALKRDSGAMRAALERLSPALAGVPLDTGEAAGVTGRDRLAPRVRRTRTLARKALTRYGGRPGRALSFAPPDPFPWGAVRAHQGFRDLVGDLLLARDRRSAELIDAVTIQDTVRDGLQRGRMYPLGLLMTLELTLREVAAA
jgi:asparagine synthetase B (glutamine-hydrolysing)